MGQHGVDHDPHFVRAVVRYGLVFEAAMGVQSSVPVAVVVAVAVGRVADDCVRPLDERQHLPAIPEIQRRIANGFDTHHRFPNSALSSSVIASRLAHSAAHAPGRPFIFRAFATAIS